MGNEIRTGGGSTVGSDGKETEIYTEGGSAIGKDVNIDEGDFVGRDKNDWRKTNEQANQYAPNVTVNVNPANPDPAPPTPRKRLMPEVEQEIRRNISDLTKSLGEVREALIDLRGTVHTNNKLTEQTINLLVDQVKAAQEIARKAEEKVATIGGVNLVMKEKPISDLKINTALGLLAFIALSIGYWVYQNSGI